jgi:hypothetical protein
MDNKRDKNTADKFSFEFFLNMMITLVCSAEIIVSERS